VISDYYTRVYGIAGKTMNVKEGKRITHVIILATAYSVFMSIYTIMKHECFMTRAYDLGIFVQALWTTIFAGKFFYETPDLGISTTGSFFGVHFAPVMFLLLLLYWIAPHPYTLLILQSFLFGFAAIPIYKLAREITKSENTAIIFAIIYLLYPPIITANLFDFHLESFFPIIFTYALYFLEQGNLRKFYIMVLLSLLILDFVSVVFALSLVFYASVIRHHRELIDWIKTRKIDKKIAKHTIACIMLAIVSIAYFILSINVIEMFGTKPFSQTKNWPDLGSNIYEIMLGLLNPVKVTKAITYDFETKILWLIMLFLPLLFLPIFAPRDLFLFLPWLLVAFLSRYPPYYQLRWQYDAIYVPFVLFAAINGYKNLTSVFTYEKSSRRSLCHFTRFFRKITSKQFLLLLLSMLFLTILLVISFPKCRQIITMDPIPIPNEHIAKLKQILSLIPDNASVLAQNNIFPHLAHRVQAYVWVPPNETHIVDYAIGDVLHPEFFMYIPNKDFRYSDLFIIIFSSGMYGVLAEADGIILLKKNYFGAPVIYEPIIRFFNYQNFQTNVGRLGKEADAISNYVFIFDSVNPSTCLWHDLRVSLPPGRYKLIIRFKFKYTRNVTENTTILKLDIYALNKQKNIYCLNITSADIKEDSWIEFAISFKAYYPDVYEFKGFLGAISIRFFIDYIKIIQLHYLP